MFTDPTLVMRLLCGPFVSARYRLQDPHPWTGARQAIMDVFPDVWHGMTPLHCIYNPVVFTVNNSAAKVAC